MRLVEWMEENDAEVSDVLGDLIKLLKYGQSQWKTDAYGKWERNQFEFTIQLLQLTIDNFGGGLDSIEDFEEKLHSIKKLRFAIERGPEYETVQLTKQIKPTPRARLINGGSARK